MKGRILLKALELLHEGVIGQIDFFAAMLAAGYGASRGHIEYEYRKRKQARDSADLKDEDLRDRKRRLSIFISKMKRDGLLEKHNNTLKISHKGKRKLSALRQTNLPGKYYAKSVPGSPVIISFDIPERFRRKRRWLREVIKNLGFTMIHQSVWVGKVKIPKSFLLDLADLKLIDCIEIFEISKTGSLKKLT